MKPIALITGASGGIGAATAKRFAEHGYAVVLQYHNNRDAAQCVADSLPNDTPYLCVQCDLRSEESVLAMRDAVHEQLGAVTVLVNCAGVALPQMLLADTTDADFTQIFETNVHGAVRVTNAFSDELREHRGAIVNLSSIWGIAGGSCEALYSASKSAIIGLTKALARELGPCGVRVNCVAPGWIDTAMNAHLSEEDRQAFVDETPLGRVGTPEDVANAILFLATADYVTGQVLCCDGGYSL